MDKAISAAEANRKFSQLLREVREGGSFVVTSHGKAVARIEPAADTQKHSEAAKAALLRRLRAGRATNVGRWIRDELYE